MVLSFLEEKEFENLKFEHKKELDRIEHEYKMEELKLELDALKYQKVNR
jgi:hypothetical protein